MLNWINDAKDPYVRDGAIGLQSEIHSRLLDQFSSPETVQHFLGSGRTAWRREALIRSQIVMRKEFCGTILEIGAGSGWCSSLLSTVAEIEKIYCLDYDPVSVQMLMPVVQKAIGADVSKIERVIGSFNHLPLENEINFIASIGALHHSEHLYASLKACFKALKPGGWLFASEPVYFDSQSNSDILAMYKKEDPASLKKYGRVTKHEDNSDHYYRFSEFIASSYSAGFDVYPFIFELDGSRLADDDVLSKRNTSSGFVPNVLYPYFAADPANPMFDRLMLMLQKPVDGGIDLGHKISAP